MAALTSELLADGQIVREPVAFAQGYWAGAPGVFHDEQESAWYLTYRIRRPRGVEPDRGGEARIARSEDLNRWEDIWSVTKGQFDSASIERCALRKGSDGQWRYFISYVDPSDGRWCVSTLNAANIQGLDARNAKPLFKARALGLEGIKDPWIYSSANKFYMFLSVAISTPRTGEQSHSTLDIFNTGECVSATGLAVSTNLDDWEWLGTIFVPEPGPWDSYCRRINSVVPIGKKLLAFYDGSASHTENYEEKCGLAVSTNWRNWQSLTPREPFLTSPHASKSLRYLDAQVVADDVHLFYEFARPDGSHDLRLTTITLASLSLYAASPPSLSPR